MELVKVKYMGNSPKFCMMPGYNGRIECGLDYPTTKENYEKELKADPRWQLVKESKKTEPKKEVKEVSKKETTEKE